jgi:hypothetical protein
VGLKHIIISNNPYKVVQSSSYMKKIFTSLYFLFFVIGIARSQSEYLPYSYQFYQKLNQDVYSTKTRFHTSLKPFFAGDSLLKLRYDSLMNYGTDDKTHGWAYRKLLTEHLIDVRSSGSTFYADLLPDFAIGRDLSGNLSTTSLGLQLGGTAGSKFYYNVSGYITNALVPDYMATYINQVGIAPGQAYARTYTQNGYDWSYITAVASYTPFKFLNISAGHDKTFIGDGYRSLLLSDYSSPYLFFKLTATLGNVRYMAMWTDMNDPAPTSQYGIYRKKFGVFHYLDWNVSNRLSVGFFENITGFFKDDNGQKRPFDFNYINPLIFMKPINNSADDPDKSLLGFTGKYKISNGLTAYGQFILNEFHAADFFSSNGAVDNKYGYQIGFRGTNLFTVKKLNFLVETNNVKPYTYQARSAIENYANNSEPLAHPWGANFRELVGLLNYSYSRFDFSVEADLGRYGLDMNNLNFGKDIFKIYTQPARIFGNYTTQGLTTNMVYFEGKIGYLLNPKYNLRIELGGLIREEKNNRFDDKTTLITIGLRSSFRQFYNDIASYRAH